MINVIFRILAKGHANRVIILADRITQPNKSAFIHDHFILDGVLVFHEVLYECFSAKALMTGGSPRLCGWSHLVGPRLTSTRRSAPSSPLSMGLDRETPFPPFLFNVVVDALATILDKDKVAGHIRGVVPHLVGGGGSPSCNDTVTMVEGSEGDITNLKFLLLCFSRISRLKINFGKSEVMILRYFPEESQLIADRLNCQLGSFPTSYLGVPIFHSRLSVTELRPTVTKLQHWIEPWQGRWLSKAARTVLINSSLSSLFLFLMSFYSLHETLHHEIAKYQSRLYWAGKGDKQKYHMVSWPDICKTCDQGGLGIMESKRMNIALLTQWLWRIANGDGGLWLDIIRNKYIRGQPLAFCQRSGGSQFWQSVIQLLPLLRIGSSISIGSGSATLFWYDRWAGDVPFATRFPDLFSIAVEPRTSVKVALSGLGRLAFRRTFGPPDVVSWDEMLECIALHTPGVDSVSDRISWRLELSGHFSTRSLYQDIAPSTTPDAITVVWAIKLPLKTRIFLWQWIRGRVPSGLEVLKHNGPGDGLCPLCETVEDSSHIFFACAMAQFLWSCFREAVGGHGCHTNAPNLFAEIQSVPPIGPPRCSRGRSGRSAISL
ncbi:ABC transporter G family member 37 [Hordeum vulgare]|nr:ABC transporter G family member 37 [Hordeum vulgare]